jgi:steroid delta-isomerase
MPDRDAMIAAVKTHCRASSEGDFDAWVQIWADDAVVEDPVGTPPHRGIETLRTTFWARSRNAAPHLTLTEDVIVCGNEALAIMSVEIGPADNRRRLSPVIDHFTFDEHAKVTGMRAFFNYG